MKPKQNIMPTRIIRTHDDGNRFRVKPSQSKPSQAKLNQANASKAEQKEASSLTTAHLQYWSAYFDLEINQLHTNKIYCVPHKGLADYQGLWFFQYQDKLIASLPADPHDQFLKLKRQIESMGCDPFKSPNRLLSYFSEFSPVLIGPAYHGELDPLRFSPYHGDDVREVSFEAVQAFDYHDDPQGWHHSGCDQNKPFFAGIEIDSQDAQDTQLVALANYSRLSQRLIFPGIYTHASYRGRGLSTKVLSYLFEHALSQDWVVAYQTLYSNQAAIKVAERLGVSPYAKHIAIRLSYPV